MPLGLMTLLLLMRAVSGASPAHSLYPAGRSAVTELGVTTFEDVRAHAADGPFTTLVEFYAPWCPHCKHFAPQYERVAEHFVGDQRVRVAAVDCVAHNSICKQNAVKSFPTMKVFHAPGEPTSFGEDGFVLKVGHDPQAIWKWIEKRGRYLADRRGKN